jgi:hypothetical protein
MDYHIKNISNGNYNKKEKKSLFKGGKNKKKKIINVNDYQIVYLVGNQYCSNKPCKLDTNIKFVPEDDNIYDSNAVKVVSIRGDKQIKLGYIGKLYTDKIRNNINRIKVYKIMKINNETEIPYYHILYTLTKYPMY